MLLLDTHVTIKAGTSNARYWRELGYEVPAVGGKGCKNGIHPLTVDVNHLQPRSNVDVRCKCDECGIKYMQRWSRNKDVCNACRTSKRLKGNNYGSANKGKILEKMHGDKHPRWNPDKTEFKKYYSAVMKHTRLSYIADKAVINPHDHPRGRCGVPGAWQLDHKVSIKEGFERNMPPEAIGATENLQMLPWKTNREKWSSYFV